MKIISSLIVLVTTLGCNERKEMAVIDLPKYKINIEINKNVETIGIILILSNHGKRIIEVNDENKNYCARSFREKFIEFEEHPTVKLVNSLAEEGLFGLYEPYFGLNYTLLPNFQKKNEIEVDSVENHTKEELDSIYNHLAQSIQKFYIDAKLESFFDNNRELYQKVVKEVQSTMISPYIIDSMAYFYNINDVENVKFNITPSLVMLEGWGFGHTVQIKETISFYQLLSHYGGSQEDLFNPLLKKTSLGFDNVSVNLEFTIHEFGHSFVDFLRDKPSNIDLINQVKFLNFENLQKKVENYGYGDTWAQCFEEHLVRASEIIMFEKLGKKDLIKEKIETEIEVYGFVYLPVFVKELKQYNENRKQYPSLEDYLPTLIDRLSKIDTTQYLF